MSDQPVDVGSAQIGIMIGVNEQHRMVIINFQSPVSHLPMPPDVARAIAKELMKQADQLEPPKVIVAPLWRQ